MFVRLPEQHPQCLLDLSYGVNLYAELLALDGHEAALGYHDVGKAKFLCLGYALLYARNGAHLARQSDLATQAIARIYRHIDV